MNNCKKNSCFFPLWIFFIIPALTLYINQSFGVTTVEFKGERYSEHDELFGSFGDETIAIYQVEAESEEEICYELVYPELKSGEILGLSITLGKDDYFFPAPDTALDISKKETSPLSLASLPEDLWQVLHKISSHDDKTDLFRKLGWYGLISLKSEDNKNKGLKGKNRRIVNLDKLWESGLLHKNKENQEDQVPLVVLEASKVKDGYKISGKGKQATKTFDQTHESLTELSERSDDEAVDIDLVLDIPITEPDAGDEYASFENLLENLSYINNESEQLPNLSYKPKGLHLLEDSEKAKQYFKESLPEGLSDRIAYLAYLNEKTESEVIKQLANVDSGILLKVMAATSQGHKEGMELMGYKTQAGLPTKRAHVTDEASNSKSEPVTEEPVTKKGRGSKSKR